MIPEQIKQARKAAGLTQKQLAERIGVPTQRIQEAESGKHSTGSKLLTAIAEGLEKGWVLS